MKKFSFLFLLILGLMSACKKDNIEKFTPNGSVTENITTSFQGIVVNEDNQAVEGATVFFDGEVKTTTDENGIFFIKNLSVPKNKAYFTIKKNGYFLGSRTVTPHQSDINRLKIRLLSNTSTYSFDNAAGGEITLTEGGKVTFEGNSVGAEDGSPYTGTVYVSAKKIDPTTMDGITSMPGDLRGVDGQNQEVVLKSFGMMAVELKGSSGEKLQILSGKTAQLTFEIPASLVASAPATIPLWYFDEAAGNWVEDGQAVLNGNEYVGAVSHFSFWNCDAPFPTVNFEATIVDENNAPLANLTVILEITGGTYDGNLGYGWTTDEGWTGGMVPANATLQLYVRFPHCDRILIQEFTTGTTDLDLGNITVNSDDAPDIYTITGKVTDCDTLPVANGYVKMELNHSEWYEAGTFPTNNDGTFSHAIGLCNTNILRLEGYDLTNFKASPSTTLDLTLTTDAGDLIACEDFDQFVTIHIDTLDFAAFDNSVSFNIGGGINHIDAHPQSDTVGFGISFYLNFTGSTPGEYTCDGWVVPSDVLPETFWSGTVSIIGYPNVAGEYIVGSYTGTISEGSPINGAFRIKRE